MKMATSVRRCVVSPSWQPVAHINGHAVVQLLSEIGDARVDTLSTPCSTAMVLYVWGPYLDQAYQMKAKTVEHKEQVEKGPQVVLLGSVEFCETLHALKGWEDDIAATGVDVHP